MPIAFSFDTLPDTAHIRAVQLVQSDKNPNAPIPFSAATLWRKVSDGTFPKPLKLSVGVTAWQVGEVRAWLVSKSGAV